LAEEARLEDVHYLQKKLREYQKSVKSLKNVNIFMDNGLWNFDFESGCIEPDLARATAKEYREVFYKVSVH
jgi:hypothetical protein